MEISLATPQDRTGTPPAPPAAQRPKTLLGLLYSGFFVVTLLKRGNAPPDGKVLFEQLQKTLFEFEQHARKSGHAGEDILDAKYAFCALVDETILSTRSPLSQFWERSPLQLVQFGDYLAGEGFFTKLEALRSQRAARLQVLEVYHMCLLLGFSGKYLLEGPEKLGYLTARLGDEIASIKGKRTTMAPSAERPDNVVNILRQQWHTWVPLAGFAIAGLVAYIALSAQLGSTTKQVLDANTEVIQPLPNTAYISITLP